MTDQMVRIPIKRAFGIDGVLHKVNLYERRNSKFQTFSLGMKQRLAIASCLLGNPEVMVFDEPTNGLDPVGIAEIRDLIRKIASEGHTIIMASHLLDEVEKVCTHVAIIKKGALLTTGPVEDVLADEDTVEISAAERVGDELPKAARAHVVAQLRAARPGRRPQPGQGLQCI